MQRKKSDPRGTAGRAKLVETARQLFTRFGASNVGINDVTAEAGVARMTLYNNFPSKEALVAAVYEEMAEATLKELSEIADAGLSDEDNILAIFDLFDRRRQQENDRGCPFIHASLQAADAGGPVYEIVHGYKAALRGHVLSLLNEDRANRMELADQIVLLLDGAVIEAYLKGVEAPVRAAKKAVTTLLRT